MKRFIIDLRNIFLGVLFCFSYVSCQSDDPIPNDEIIDLKILNEKNIEISQAIGDGETIITLEVTIPKKAGDNYKTVTFKKSAGQFMGSPDTSVTKPIDNDGKARVNLKIPLGTEPLLISAEIGSSGGKLFIDEEVITLVGVDEIIKLSTLDLQGNELSGVIRADGTTVLLLKATVLSNTTSLNQIVFNASNGIFQNNNSLQITKAINTNHEAIVSYKVPKDVGTLFFSSAVGVNSQYFDESSLTLQRAHADAIVVEPALVTMDTIQGNLLKVYLTRNIGSVSTGTPATFQALQIINGTEVNVGRFTGLATAVTNTNGDISVTFYADSNDITDNIPVKIRVKTFTDSGNEIMKEISLIIRKKAKD